MAIDFDERALMLLKQFRKSVDIVISGMEEGDSFNPSTIGGIIDLDLLLEIRDCLVIARTEQD